MGILDILGWAIFGLVAGAIARLLHPGRDPLNWLWTMALGIGGALVGGFIGEQLGFEANEGIASWIAAIGGAILLLVIYYQVTAPRARAANAAAGYTSDDYKRSVFDRLSRGRRG